MVHSVHRACCYNYDTIAFRRRRWKQKEERVTYLESETRIYVRWFIELRKRNDTLPDTKNKATKNVKSIRTTKALCTSYSSAKYLRYEKCQKLLLLTPRPLPSSHDGNTQWALDDDDFLPGEDLGTYKTVTASLQGRHIHPWSRNRDLPHGRSMVLSAGSRVPTEIS